ncbi:hypothetical protein [Armatimonas rosea]|uniref:Uncharacterized protein n=1 Tax=Armatimonas rosea TaxID=685828 RepID=A0A7W9SRM4_ARMRO|nr:hypothetical protein [Armatimonas rosea]MBB6051441.1 hypothetical protein [Armatimonas rosea]
MEITPRNATDKENKMKTRIVNLALAALVVAPCALGTQSHAMGLKLGSVKLNHGLSLKRIGSDLSLKKVEHAVHNAFDLGKHL